jgi:hypothetical protein
MLTFASMMGCDLEWCDSEMTGQRSHSNRSIQSRPSLSLSSSSSSRVSVISLVILLLCTLSLVTACSSNGNGNGNDNGGVGSSTPRVDVGPRDWSGCWQITGYTYPFVDQFDLNITSVDWCTPYNGNWTQIKGRLAGSHGVIENGTLSDGGRMKFWVRYRTGDSFIDITAPTPSSRAVGQFCNARRGTNECYTSMYVIDGLHQCDPYPPVISTLLHRDDVNNGVAKSNDAIIPPSY